VETSQNKASFIFDGVFSLDREIKMTPKFSCSESFMQ